MFWFLFFFEFLIEILIRSNLIFYFYLPKYKQRHGYAALISFIKNKLLVFYFFSTLGKLQKLIFFTIGVGESCIDLAITCSREVNCRML